MYKNPRMIRHLLPLTKQQKTKHTPSYSERQFDTDAESYAHIFYKYNINKPEVRLNDSITYE